MVEPLNPPRYNILFFHLVDTIEREYAVEQMSCAGTSFRDASFVRKSIGDRTPFHGLFHLLKATVAVESWFVGNNHFIAI